jgi:hypothetical protein
MHVPSPGPAPGADKHREADLIMPVFLFARHAAWMAFGVYGAFSLPATVALIAFEVRDLRRQKKGRRPVVLAPLTLTAEELEKAHRRLLRDARDAS